MKPKDLLERAARGDTQNIKFADLQKLVEALGFQPKRTRGSHHVYSHPDLDEVMNLQPLGRQAKSYQVRQVVDLVTQYSLKVENDQ